MLLLLPLELALLASRPAQLLQQHDGSVVALQARLLHGNGLVQIVFGVLVVAVEIVAVRVRVDVGVTVGRAVCFLFAYRVEEYA